MISSHLVDDVLLGRHAIALALSTEISDEVSGAVTWIQCPADGSGMVATSFTWVQSDALTLVLNCVVPCGTPPLAGIPRSEWGSTPITLLLGMRSYD